MQIFNNSIQKITAVIFMMTITSCLASNGQGLKNSQTDSSKDSHAGLTHNQRFLEFRKRVLKGVSFKAERKLANPVVAAIGSAALKEATKVIVSILSEKFRAVEITIENHSRHPLVFTGTDITSGSLTSTPPFEIPPGQAGVFGAFSKPGFYGTEGKVFYKYRDRPLVVYWDNPFSGKNKYGAELRHGGDRSVRIINADVLHVANEGIADIKMIGTGGNHSKQTVAVHGTDRDPSPPDQSKFPIVHKNHRMKTNVFHKCLAANNQYYAWLEGNLSHGNCVWEVIQLSDKVCALRNANGKYLCGRNDGRVNLEPVLDAWEKWTVIDLPNNSFYLKSHHGTFLSARPEGWVNLVREPKEWEVWTRY